MQQVDNGNSTDTSVVPVEILIAGCGYVGSRLAAMLLADGQRVCGVRRAWGKLIPGLTAVKADLTQPGTLPRLPGLRQIVYAASAGEFSDAAYRKIYVDGLAQTLAYAAACVPAIERFLLVSSTGVYGVGNGDWVDEDTPTNASKSLPDNIPGNAASFSAARLLEGEELLRRSSLPHIVVRLGGIYGPGRMGLLQSLRDGTARLDAKRPLWTNRIHLEDAAGAIKFLLALPQPQSLYLAVDDEPTLKDEILLWCSQELGLPRPPEGDGGMSPQRGNRRCRNSRLRAAGYSFVYPSFREGMRSLWDERAKV